MKEGSIFYFEQVDNISGKAVYRMHIAEARSDRIIVDIENVSTIKYLLVPVFHPGELQSVYFLDRESDTVWHYYSMARAGRSSNRLIPVNQSSAINRTVAFYRHIVGIRSDQEPPAAR